MGAGGDPVEAMSRATDLSMAELRVQLRNYMRTRIPGLRITYDFPPVEMTISRLPDPADDLLLLLAQRLKIGVASDERADTAQDVRRAAAGHPDDSFALLTLGHAELHFGDAAVGEAILNRLLERDPDNVEALQLLASARMTQAEGGQGETAQLMGQARGYLARAYRADDANYHTFHLIARTRTNAANYPTDNDLETWALAHQLAPQLASVRLGYAGALMVVDRTGEVIVLLEPLANSPHSGGAGEAAQAMIELAMSRQAAAAVPVGGGTGPGASPQPAGRAVEPAPERGA